MATTEMFPLSRQAIAELDDLYRSTRDVRVKTRAQIILLAGEKRLPACEIAAIVRKDPRAIAHWIERYLALGLDGLKDARRSGATPKITLEYREMLISTVLKSPKNLGLPYSLWTLQRLADYMAEQTAIRVEPETVRLYLKQTGIVLSRLQQQLKKAKGSG